MERVSLSNLLDTESNGTAAHLALSGHVLTSGFAISEDATTGAFPDTFDTVKELDCVACVFHNVV